MNRYLLILGFLALAVLGGCTRSEVQGEGDSYVTVSTVADASLNIKQTKASGYTIPLPADYSYTVRHMGDKSVVAEGGSTDALGTLALMAGNYLFEVASVGEASLDRPSYAGSATFSVKKGATTAVEVKAKLTNSVVAVRFSDAVKSGFKSYKATISAQGLTQAAVFDASTPEGKLVYLPAPATKVVCKIEVETKQGIPFKTEQTVDALSAADLLAWTVDVPNYEEQPTDPLVLELALDRTLNEEQKNFTVPLTPSATGVPTITGRLVDASQLIGVKKGVGANVRFDVITAAGFSKVLLMFRIGQEPLAGKPPVGILDIMAMSADERAGWGVVFDQGGTVGATETLLNLSQMTKMMPGPDAGTANYYVTVGVLDNNGQYTARELVFNVYGVSVSTTDVVYDQEQTKVEDVWVTTVRLSGRYNLDNVPDGMTFRYRENGGNWLNAEAQYSTSTKEVWAEQTFLANGQKIEYELYEGINYGGIRTFSAAGPQIENMSLDAWGGGTRANPDNWGSPNYDGVIGIGVVNSTSRQTGRTGVGYAARIVSSEASKANKFASGGLFTGTMSVDMETPYKSAQVGKPFMGRPKQLVGYFKYAPQTINDKLASTGDPGNGAKEGDLDRCEIAIKLEKWGGNTYSIRWKDGFFGTPDPAQYTDGGRTAVVTGYDGTDSKIPTGPFNANIRNQISVGYGRITSTGQADWTRFEIDIDYFQDKIPDRLIITAVSSAYGGYMSGALGSELWIDDLELIY